LLQRQLGITKEDQNQLSSDKENLQKKLVLEQQTTLQQIEIMKNHNASLQDQLMQLQGKFSRLETTTLQDQQEKAQKLQDTKETQQKLTQELSQAQNKYLQLENAHQDLKRQLQQETNTLSTELQTVKDEKVMLERKLKSLQEENSSNQELLSTLQFSAKDKQKKLYDYEVNFDKLKHDSMKQIQDVTQKLTALQEDHEQLKTKYEILQGQVINKILFQIFILL
jgi:chromosome segregation ATPase